MPATDPTTPANTTASTTDFNSNTSTAPGATGRQVDGELLQLVSFMVGTEEFAVPILSVQEINRMMQITRVPQSPPFIEGVINLRGKIIPVMDLRKRFGLQETGDASDERIIVVEVGARVIGFTVDQVNEVLRISADIVEPPPAMVCGVDSDYVQGVGKLEDRLLILLDLDRLFNSADMAQFDEAAKAADNLAA